MNTRDLVGWDCVLASLPLTTKKSWLVSEKWRDVTVDGYHPNRDCVHGKESNCPAPAHQDTLNKIRECCTSRHLRHVVHAVATHSDPAPDAGLRAFSSVEHRLSRVIHGERGTIRSRWTCSRTPEAVVRWVQRSRWIRVVAQPPSGSSRGESSLFCSV